MKNRDITALAISSVAFIVCLCYFVFQYRRFVPAVIDGPSISASYSGGKQQTLVVQSSGNSVSNQAKQFKAPLKVSEGLKAFPPESPTKAMASLFEGHPDFEKAYLEAYKARINILYAPLFKRMSLSDAQQTRFVEIVLKRREDWADLQAMANAPTHSDLSGGIKEMETKSVSEYEANMRNLLGVDGLKEFKDFRRTFNERETLQNVAASAFSMGVPINYIQGEKLVQLLAGSKLEPYRNGVDLIFPTDKDYDKMFTSAAAFLSEAQLTALQATMSPEREKYARYRATRSQSK